MSADGFSSTLATNILALFNGTAPTSYASGAVYVSLATGAPGTAGTANPSTGAGSGAATRSALTLGTATYNAGSNTSSVAAGTPYPSWTNTGSTGSTTETVTDITVWGGTGASTGTGTFLFSAPLSPTKTWGNGDTISLTSLTVSLPTAN